MACRTAIAVFALLAAIACVDRDEQQSTQPRLAAGVLQDRTARLDSLPEMLDTLPNVQIATPEHPLPPPMTDAELVAAVSAADGRVMIGLKPASARRSHETGIVPGISKGTALAARATLTGFGATITRSYRFVPAVAATIRPALASRIRALPIVDYVEPVFSGQVQSDDGSFGIGKQDTTWGVTQVRAPDVWSGVYGPSTRGEGVFITQLDVGLDETHRWTGDGPAGLNLDCYYYIGTSCYANVGDSSALGHGAHVAGIIASINNSTGGIGVAWNPAGFASIRVCSWINGLEQCPEDAVVAGLDWALAQSASHPRQIVNISLAWCTDYSTVRDILATFNAHGILVVASAGNYYIGMNSSQACPGGQTNNVPDWPTGIMFPARYNTWPYDVIAVAGTKQYDTFAVAPQPPGGGGPWPPPPDTGMLSGVPAQCSGWGSRYGPQVDIAAPFWAYSMWTGGRYYAECGTSMSAAFVTGVAALVWSHNPSWTAFQVRQQVIANTAPVHPSGFYGSFGRVDAVASVYSQLPPPPPPPPPSVSVTIAGPNPVPAYAYCSWVAAAYGGTEPYSYSWTVDGSAAGDGSSTLGVTTPAGNFSIHVVATDANSLTGSATVSVSIGGTGCGIE